MSERQERRTLTGRRGWRGWEYVLGNILAMAITVTVAASTLWPVYESIEFLRVLAAAFGAGAAIALLGARFRWPSPAVVLSTVGTYLLLGVPLAIPSEATGGLLPTADGFVQLLTATALSWKQLVTVVLPVGAYQALLVPALILILLSTVIGLSVALRARTAEFAVLAPVGLFVSGIALGPSSVSSPIGAGMALFVSVLFWLLWLRWQRRRASIRLVAQQSRGTIQSASDRRLAAARGLLSAAVIIAVAIAVGTSTALAVPSSAPRDVVRTRVQQPFDPRSYPSPLSGFRGYLQPEVADTPLLTVRGLPEGGRIRLAALDTYDGIVYSVGSGDVASASGSFTRLPFRLDQSSVAGTPLDLAVTIDGYDDVWVPGDGQLERIQFTGRSGTARADSFYYNDNSGTGAVLGGLRAGDSYVSRSVVPRPVDDLAGIRPGRAVLPLLGTVPDELKAALETYVRPADAPGVQLQAMLDAVKANGYISHGIGAEEPASRSGHGADRIAQLFTQRPMLGDQEQYAVAATLMARLLGFPARVVVGFDPGRAGRTVTVTGADVSAWMEVQARNGEWITIDPTPPVRAVPERQPDEPTVVSRPQTVVPPVAQDTTQQPDLTPPDRTKEDPQRAVDPVLAFLLGALRIAGWVLLGAAVLLAPFLGVVIAKVRRRRIRQGRGPVEKRVRGGWDELADTVVDFGMEAPPAATRLELAASIGDPRGIALAAVVDRAVFAPGEPTAADADHVWNAVDELRVALARARTRRQRLRALISVRSFGRYAGRTRTPRNAAGHGARRTERGGTGS